MSHLIAESVRAVYGGKREAGATKVIAKAGRGLVVMPKGIRITDADVSAALEEMA